MVAAFPFVARLVETSLRELDEGVVEAAQSMGATPFQIITKVMIPECLPGLISSMTTALTTILGYSAMSGVIGGGGLLPLSDQHHDRLRRAAGAHGAGVPDCRYLLGDQER